MRRPPRLRRHWSFERLERRILLSGAPNPVGINPVSSVSGDFNRDGALDVVTADEGSNDVTILLGNGDGTFQTPRTFPAGVDPIAVTADDFNGDGRLDLAVADQGDPNTGQGRGVTILLGNGDGTFQAPVLYDAGITPTSIVAGDFEGADHPLDLAVAGTGSNGVSYVSILQGDGFGGFHLSQMFALGDAVALPKSLVAGDFEGADRPLDLAVANSGSNNVTILLGDGQGEFQVQSPIALGDSALSPISIVAGDFEGADRPLDLAVANSGSNNISILLGDGQGGFQVQPPIQLGQGTKPTSLTAVNFEADGTLDDLAIADAGTNQVSLLKANGDGTFQPEPSIALGDGGAPSTILAGDFNRDGIPDLAISRQGPNENDVAVELNLGGYQFADPGTIDLAAHNTPIVADFTGDGIPDVAIIDASGDILFRQGRADQPGSFDPPIIINPDAPSRAIASVRTSQGVLLASVDAGNNPGGPSPGTISLFAYRNGQFTRVGSLPTGPWPAQLVSADLTGDGWDDLIVRNAGAGTLTLYRSDGHGWFLPGIDIPVGLSASDFTVSDIAQDGLPDLVVTNHVSGEVEVLPNEGGGNFGPPLQSPAGSGLSSQEETAGVVAGAFTQGGPPDLVTINPGTNTFAVLAGLGGGAFANPLTFPTTSPATVVRTGDFTGNGILDLAVLGADGVSVYLGNGHGGFGEPTTYPTGPNPTGLTVADVSGDGIPDLLVGNTFGDVLVLQGDGKGDFAPSQPVDQQIELAVADLRGNGERDVIFTDQALDRVTVQYGVSGPQSVIGDRSQGLMAPGAVTEADLDGDGISDLIVANCCGNDVLIYPGLGNGQFGPAQAFAVGTDPVGITVADLNGRPDLVVADEGSNDIAVLLNVPTPGGGFTFTNGPRLQLKTPTKQGIGPVATTVLTPPGGGPADLLVSNSGSNDVWLLPGVGGGFFNDQDPTIFPVGRNPGPLFVGNFMGRPGQLDLVTVNAGSNDLTLIPDFLHGGQAQEISSGGTDPVAALAGDFLEDGRTDLLVANNGDGRLALLLGGLDGLNLTESMVNPAVPHPTALALDVLTGNLHQ
ncbi:MAG: VCBS repeat-containing protein, partial [Planctomycetaceae bacterium]|nr:VCBS repeat-containing protein [Planctomycetaceae bacterium]